MWYRILCLYLSVLTLLGTTFCGGHFAPEADYGRENKGVERNMDKYVGIESHVAPCGGVPTLFVNGEAYPSVAYMTYLEKFNAYEDFSRAGYQFFSVPLLFAGRWISITDGFTPFKKGIYDVQGAPDYSPMDEAVRKILDVCPDALIFPRVNVTMPVWWEESHPEDVNIKDGKTCRESLYSETWREDVKKNLRDFVRYVNTTDYADHIVGYQIAGGNTEEWFHFDMNAGYCDNAQKGFQKFLTQYYPDVPFTGLPDMKHLNKSGNYHKDDYLAHYLEYASYAVADAITDLAHLVKEETGGNVVVGTFYGYSLEVTSSFHGTHALQVVLDDPNVDFICSPNSYIGIRAADCDWTEMYPADSVRLHGKMCFQECDIRTHLTKILHDKDPETDPNANLDAPIWQGLDSKEQAQNLVRRSFCRQLIKGNGLWWFDMWGGWYADEDIMNEMATYKTIYENSLSDRRGSVAEVAVFVDESAYKYMTNGSLRNASYTQRKELGQMGASYDVYDVFDFAEVYGKYNAVIFLNGTQTAGLQKALALCKEKGVSYLLPSALKPKFTVRELRAFCQKNGVYSYCESNDIVYVNEQYVAIQAVSAGEKTISLPRKMTATGLLGTSAVFTDTSVLTMPMEKGQTVLFRLNG